MLSPLRSFARIFPGRNASAHSIIRTGIVGFTVSRARWLAAFAMALAMLLSLPAPAHAQVIEVLDARIEYQDGGYELEANFDFDLPPALEDALHKGISLYFLTEFQLTRPRWYWIDERPVNTSRSVRLSFHPLTRQYRISTGGLQLPFTRLRSALDFIQHVRGWRVFDRGTVRVGETYQAEVRMRLDLTQLPKPFQINAVNTREWNLTSEWRRFNYTASETPPPAPASTPAPAAPLPASPPATSELRASPFAQTVSSALSPSLLGPAAVPATPAQP